MSDTPPKSTTAIAQATLGRMPKHHLFRDLIPFLPDLAIAALACAGMDHDDAIALVKIVRPIATMVWRRWRDRRRSRDRRRGEE